MTNCSDIRKQFVISLCLSALAYTLGRHTIICLPQLQALFFWQEHLVISFHAESLVPSVDVR